MSGKISVVVGGQFGSEAKGAVAGYLAAQDGNVVCVRIGGPNAGHTVYGRCPQDCDNAHRMFGDEAFAREHPHPWRLRQIPVAAVTNPSATLLIAAGSEVDFTVLRNEWNQLNSAGYKLQGRLNIDYTATVLEQKHIEAEMVNALPGKIGSTGKGIGAARADRIWRNAATVHEFYNLLRSMGILMVDSTTMLETRLMTGAHVVIEGTQGYGLGLHTDYYPKCTSGDCRAIDFLAQSGLSPWSTAVSDLEVWVVARTYPIRVAGNSGPLEGETSWDELGLEPERTTVTNKVRRVGQWDSELVRNAVFANGGGDFNPRVRLALTMADYKIPEIKGLRRIDQPDEESYKKLMVLIREVEEQVRARVGLVGTGPTSIIDLR